MVLKHSLNGLSSLSLPDSFPTNTHTDTRLIFTTLQFLSPSNTVVSYVAVGIHTHVATLIRIWYTTRRFSLAQILKNCRKDWFDKQPDKWCSLSLSFFLLPLFTYCMYTHTLGNLFLLDYFNLTKKSQWFFGRLWKILFLNKTAHLPYIHPAKLRTTKRLRRKASQQSTKTTKMYLLFYNRKNSDNINSKRYFE